jgi:hypothetical protein
LNQPKTLLATVSFSTKLAGSGISLRIERMSVMRTFPTLGSRPSLTQHHTANAALRFPQRGTFSVSGHSKWLKPAKSKLTVRCGQEQRTGRGTEPPCARVAISHAVTSRICGKPFAAMQSIFARAVVEPCDKMRSSRLERVASTNNGHWRLGALKKRQLCDVPRKLFSLAASVCSPPIHAAMASTRNTAK